MVDSFDLVQRYLSKADWKVKENANIGYSLQGLNVYLSGEDISDYWLNHVYPPEITRAHVEGDFHLHDLGMLSAYCCGWDLQDLIHVGFGHVSAKVQCKPPKHFRSALGQAVNFIYTMSGEVAGASAFSNFDTLMAPFIKVDKLTYEEVKQCVQEFIYNMNVPTRTGAQVPFSNITLDLVVPKHYEKLPAIVGGVAADFTYSDCQKEMDLFNKAFAEVMSEGDASERVFTFPIPTYNVTKDFDWNSEAAIGVFKMAAKYGIPYFANFINSDMKPEDARSLCCKLRISNADLVKRGGGMFGAYPLTGSLSVVTINMPRLGYLSKSESEFFNRLSALMDLAKLSLELKRIFVEEHTEKGLYPYSRFYLRYIKQARGKYWANHFNTIGLVGVNEACVNFLGKDISTPEGKAFALKILNFMRERLSLYQTENEDVLWNLEATPAEGTSYRLAKLDKLKYPEIKVANNSPGARPFYTNSTLLPVDATRDLFEALDHQDDLQVLYSGGSSFHTYLGEEIDWQQARTLVRKVLENYHLPYLSLTPTFSICPKHGYLKGKYEYCPKCDEEIGYIASSGTNVLVG